MTIPVTKAQAQTIAESVAKVSDSKGLAAIGVGLGWGIGSFGVALALFALLAAGRWDGRIVPETRCFELKDVGGRVFKVNSCTGDVQEVPARGGR